MQDRTWTFVDKTTWGDGPWRNEPDKAQWTDRTTGLPCLVVRGPLGNLCGYVGVSEGHPYFGKDNDTVPVDCHGGLTFADKCSGDEHGVCHVVEPGEDDQVWWFGFDFAHLNDLVPSMRQHEVKWRAEIPGYAAFERHDYYWTLPEVQAECVHVAVQLAAADAGTEAGS